MLELLWCLVFDESTLTGGVGKWEPVVGIDSTTKAATSALVTAVLRWGTKSGSSLIVVYVGHGNWPLSAPRRVVAH